MKSNPKIIFKWGIDKTALLCQDRAMMKKTMRFEYQHIRNHPAYEDIAKMLARGINQTSIAWHLNNRRPFVAPPYGAKEWTAVLVTNVYNCHEPEGK